MKLTRRSFLGILSSLVATPLVAKDMGDFDFLPPVLEAPPKIPFIPAVFRPEPVGVTGQLRYNLDTQQFEIYKTNHWETILTMEQVQDDYPQKNI